MKPLKYFVSIALFATSVSLFAQKYGPDSAACIRNYSLFSEFAKLKNYEPAIKPWEDVLKNCPAAYSSTYSYGVSIVKYQIAKAEKAKDEAKKKELIEQLMKLYDMRAEYFGSVSRRYPAPYILGMKGLEMMSYYQGDIAKQKESKDLLKSTVRQLDGNTFDNYQGFITGFMLSSYNLYKANELPAEEFIENYELAQTIIAQKIKTELSDSAALKELSDNFSNVFANSGAADCTTLEKLFGQKVEALKTDKDGLDKVVNLFEKLNCTESPIYFKAAEYQYDIAPSSSSAFGLAKMYISQKNNDRAIEYLKQAIDLETVAEKRASYEFQLAVILYSDKKEYAQAREFALKAAKDKAGWGLPYIHIGIMYALSAQEQKLGAKDIENKAGYWAAVDKFQEAKRIDPSVASEADLKIKLYMNYFPLKENIFFEPDYQVGKSVLVGGWIQERTIVRSKD